MKVGRGELMYERISVGKAVEKQLLCTQSARKLLILKCSLLTTLKEVVSVVVLVFWIYFNHDPAYLGRDGFYPVT